MNRLRCWCLTFILMMTWMAVPASAQHTAAEDSAKWRLDKLDFDSIKKDNTAPQYSKRAQARVRLRDSLYSLGPSGPVVATIEIHGTGTSLPVGSTMQLSTTVKDASGVILSTPVLWSTTSTTNGTITTLGLLSGTSVGTITVVARSQTISTSRSFTVTSTSPLPVASVLIASSPDSVRIGSTLQLSASAKAADGTTLSNAIVWSSGTPAVGTISSAGLVAGITVGSTVITARADTATSTRTIRVVAVIDTTTPPIDTTTPPVVIFTHPYAPPSNGAAFAEMPRDTVGIAIPTVLRTINVTSLQAAYDTAKTGDLLKLPSGVTFISPTFGLTSRTGWVTIQGTDSTSTISQTVGGSTSAVNIGPQAHHIYFLGPLTITTTTSTTNAMYRSYNGETSNSQVAHHIVANGVKWWVPDSVEVRRCAWPDGAYMAIVNSKMYGCASKSGDAQAILLVNGPGPFRFENNYLEGGHQCFMSGGSDPSIPNNIPSDIVFRYNTCFKPYVWHFSGTPPNQTYTIRAQRQVKTIIEAKNMRRGLFEHNLLRNVYVDAQAGFCLLWKSTNQNGTAPQSQTVDATFRYNRCVGMSSGANLAAHPQGGVAMTRISIYDNKFDSLSTTGGEGIGLQILDDVVDVIALHNTFSNTTNQAISFDGAPGVRTVVSKNIIPNGAYGVKGSGSTSGNATITKWMPNGLFQENVIAGADCNAFPSGTFCSLPNPLPTSSDGKKIGADASVSIP